MIASLAFAALLAAANAPCRAVPVAPEKRLRADGSELYIADIDNDGVDDRVIVGYEGSGGYLALSAFERVIPRSADLRSAVAGRLVRQPKSSVVRPEVGRLRTGGPRSELPRSAAQWRRKSLAPLDDLLQAANDYYDPLTRQRQVLVRFCGRTYLTLMGGAGPHYSRDAWLWERGKKPRLVCDAPWLAEQRRAFQRLFDAKRYDDAHGFLDGAMRSCGVEASSSAWLWMESDLALAAYRMGALSLCLEHVKAAENSGPYTSAGEAVRRALRANAELCRAAPPPVDLAWLLELRDSDRQYVLDRRFERVLSAIVPEATFEDGTRLRDTLELNLYLPDKTQVVDGRYVILSGCRPHDCSEKGFAWIDVVQKTSVIAVGGVIGSTSYLPPDIPAAAWSALRDSMPMADDEPVAFYGPNGVVETIIPPAAASP